MLSMADHEHMMSKKPKPTSGYVSFIFKDMPSWKVNKLFVNNQEEKDFDFKDELHSIEHALAEINAGSEECESNLTRHLGPKIM